MNKYKARPQLTVRIANDLMNRMRNIVYWSPDLSVNSFVETALSELVEKFEKDKSRCKDQRPKDIKVGRRRML